MAKKITSKHFEIKRTVEGTNTTVTFVPNVKTVVCPIIKDSFIGDDGEVWHNLTTGNTISDANYIKFWGARKGVINWAAKTERVNPNPFVIK